MKMPRILPLIAIAVGGIIAVRAAGLAPELFQGAQAWAQEGVVPAGDAALLTTASAPAVCALSEDQLAEQAGISPAELRIIQRLSDRRGELDARDADFATMLPLMAAAEQKLDERMAALNAIKAELEGMLGQADEREQAEINRLVEVYQAMRPREAAAVFTSLADSVRLPVAQAMRPRALAAIMAQMPPAAARELTEKLADRYEAQQLAARAEAVARNAPAPAPVPAPVRTAEAPPQAPPARRPAQAQARAQIQTPPAPPPGPQPYEPDGGQGGRAEPARQTVQ
ncbi:MAG: MotE family protein [Brevundimonas sp.]|uniref:MotE family protein n=1 Tax=Brevundimonas sp. TaxID=1871086 RepID=UPI00391CD74C